MILKNFLKSICDYQVHSEPQPLYTTIPSFQSIVMAKPNPQNE